jgi:hypothetical protein
MVYTLAYDESGLIDENRTKYNIKEVSYDIG